MEAIDIPVDIGLVYSLNGPFPDLELTNPHDDQLILNVAGFLEQRINKRNILRADFEEKRNNQCSCKNVDQVYKRNIN